MKRGKMYLKSFSVVVTKAFLIIAFLVIKAAVRGSNPRPPHFSLCFFSASLTPVHHASQIGRAHV